MNNNNILKLSNYMLDCVKATQKASGFNNISKDKKINFCFNGWAVDNKEINEILTESALNKSTMTLIYGTCFIEAQKGREVFYSPLLYAECKLIRQDDKIMPVVDFENDLTINYGVIASLFNNNNDLELIENKMEQLTEIINPMACDFRAILQGLFGEEVMEDNNIKFLDNNNNNKEEKLILSKIPENLAGLMNELKTIIKNYS